MRGSAWKRSGEFEKIWMLTDYWWFYFRDLLNLQVTYFSRKLRGLILDRVKRNLRHIFVCIAMWNSRLMVWYNEFYAFFTREIARRQAKKNGFVDSRIWILQWGFWILKIRVARFCPSSGLAGHKVRYQRDLACHIFLTCSIWHRIGSNADQISRS